MILIPAIWELLQFYDMSRCKFKMATAGERNNVIKLLLMKDIAGVEQAVAKRAAMRGGKHDDLFGDRRRCIYIKTT